MEIDYYITCQLVGILIAISYFVYNVDGKIFQMCYVRGGHMGIRKFLMTIISFYFVGSSLAYPDTHTAASCSATNVAAAIAAAANGDDVVIPAGTCTWSSVVTISKPITLRGSGKDITTITLSPTGWNGAIVVNAHATLNTRISNMTLSGGGYLIGVNGAYSNSGKVRIDNIKTAPSGNGFVVWFSNQPGLIDNCQITFSGMQEIIHVFGDDSASWARASNMGTGDMLIVENNTFTATSGAGPSALTSFEGSRWTFRYNHIYAAIIDTHPGWVFGHTYGGRQWEIYNNTWHTKVYALGDLKAGTGVIFNNTSLVGGTIGFHLPTLQMSPCCCVSNLNGTYCTQRPGFGGGQIPEPIYVWNNTGMSVGPASDSYGTACDSTCGGHQTHSQAVRLNIEYYNTAKPGYTPYTYPHPLSNSIPNKIPLAPGITGVQ